MIKTLPKSLIESAKRILSESQNYSPSSQHFDENEIENNRNVGFKSRTKLVNMPIDDFLSVAKYTTGFGPKLENVRGILNSGNKISSIPQLYVSGTESPDIHEVTGHEGRHRAMVLKERGHTHIPVNIIHSSIRWSEQSDPNRFDYKENWPTRLNGEDGLNTIKFPISRDDSVKPFSE